MTEWRREKGRAALLGLAQLGFMIALSAVLPIVALVGWFELHHISLPLGVSGFFYFAASVVIAVSLFLYGFMANQVQHAVKEKRGEIEANSDSVACVLIGLGLLGVSAYFLFRGVTYSYRLNGNGAKVSCGSWAFPSRYVLHYNISPYCVGHLDGSFRWALVLAAADLIIPLTFLLWQFKPQELRDLLRAFESQ
jgi:hypothetical protein